MTLIGLFLLFLKIGFFTFGGGYAMIPLCQTELVNKLGLLSTSEFADIVALAQMTPGPVGLNAATYIGQQQCGIPGALAATLGVITPSLTFGVLVALFLKLFERTALIKNALKGIRPATLGLIASAVFFFAETSVFTGSLSDWAKDETPTRVSIPGAVVFAMTLFISLRFKRLNLVVVLLAAAVMAVILDGVF